MKRWIDDDFDPEKIRLSGQCFRIQRLDERRYLFVTGSQLLILNICDQKNEALCLELSCDAGSWEKIWRPYFDLDRSYRGLRAEESEKSPFIKESMRLGKGLRILRQDPWETLVSFILSQRKSLPAIARCVELLCRKFGRKVMEIPGGNDVYTFPSAMELLSASEGELAACGLGYRLPYLQDAARRCASGELSLESLASLPDRDLLEALSQVKGVGLKVASCVALFAYGRTGLAPVDVWIGRAIKEHFAGQSPFPAFGDHAGIIQQYIFYAMKWGRPGQEE